MNPDEAFITFKKQGKESLFGDKMVAVVLHGPPWFFLLDAVLGFVGMAGAIVIVALSAKALKLTKDRKFIYFTIAFALIGLGLLIRSMTNVVVFLGLPWADQVMSAKISDYRGYFFFVGYGAFIVSTVVGYVLLAVSTMKIREPRITILLTALVLLLLGLSSSYFLSFYLVSTILLAFITYHVCRNCLERKSVTAGLVFAAFALQLFANVAFVLELYHQLFYYVANISLLAGYGVLLLALVRVLWGKR